MIFLARPFFRPSFSDGAEARVRAWHHPAPPPNGRSSTVLCAGHVVRSHEIVNFDVDQPPLLSLQTPFHGRVDRRKIGKMMMSKSMNHSEAGTRQSRILRDPPGASGRSQIRSLFVNINFGEIGFSKRHQKSPTSCLTFRR
mgnify:CR=1 FL=1